MHRKLRYGQKTASQLNTRAGRFGKFKTPELDNLAKQSQLKQSLVQDLLRANSQGAVSPNHPRLHSQFVQKLHALVNRSIGFTISHGMELALLSNVDSHARRLIKELLELNRRLSGNKILKIPAARIEARAAVELGMNFSITWDSDNMIVAPKQMRQYKPHF